jgi:hypothetical protein
LKKEKRIFKLKPLIEDKDSKKIIPLLYKKHSLEID